MNIDSFDKLSSNIVDCRTEICRNYLMEFAQVFELVAVPIMFTALVFLIIAGGCRLLGWRRK